MRTDEARTERHAHAWLERPYARGRLRHATQGQSVFTTCLHGELASHGGAEILISFKPYPPYAHFRRPGR
ncbi:hypothetical protein ABZT04_14350 [Streptomyces sp. NPDC005492]|uniref:hypothetical protein n=1 Tax=Streptomyces sp. NPDC005492 TaxID=3156883 RepID=UPI0033B3E482